MNPIITVKFIYAPPQGPGTPGEDDGITIDAWDAILGGPVDNYFVSSVTGSTSTVSEANADGWVDTTSATGSVSITADSPNIGAPYAGPMSQNAATTEAFLHWLVLPGSALQAAGSTSTLTAAAQNSGIALAIYQNPMMPPKLLSKDATDFKVGKDAKDHHKEGGHEKIPYKGEHGSEVVGYPPRDDSAAIELLNQRLALLESRLSTATKGQAFIRESERPKVGLPPDKKKRR
jgi:hypothetical protein